MSAPSVAPSNNNNNNHGGSGSNSGSPLPPPIPSNLLPPGMASVGRGARGGGSGSSNSGGGGSGGTNNNNSNNSNNNNNNNNQNNTSSSSSLSDTKRPSHHRRCLLSEELSVPLVSNFFPIERYYDAADKVYDSFQQAFLDMGSSRISTLDDAYVYGKRYCTFCLEAIPQHHYYGTKKYSSYQKKHTMQVVKVLAQLEDVVACMDVEEAKKMQLAREAAEREAAERERKQQEEFERFQRQYKQQQQQQQQHHVGSSSAKESAMSKLKRMQEEQEQKNKQQEMGPPPYQSITSRPDADDDDYDPLRIPRDPSGEELGKPSSRYRFVESDEEDDPASGSLLPPPLPPPSSASAASTAATAAATSVTPSAPPSYDEALSQRPFLGPIKGPSAASMIGDDNDDEGARGGRGSSSNGNRRHQSYGSRHDPATISTQQPSKPKRRMPMSQLQEHYRMEYIQHQHAKKIMVSGLDTYQGRIGDSTNGCTVISALVAAKHLATSRHHTNGASSSGISDSDICQVIDRNCGPLLREIRDKLGLGGHALIIPSDVHDHLVDRKILRQDDFVGAAGGNIMDEQHMEQFIKLLRDGNENGYKKHDRAAATLFFREHVISIVKIPVSTSNSTNGQRQTTWHYDLVDSLPNLSSPNGRGMASRTRCADIESLLVLLRYYASKKFSSSNCTYIDRNKWDDIMADLDPRVFQGFVWAC